VFFSEEKNQNTFPVLSRLYPAATVEFAKFLKVARRPMLDAVADLPGGTNT
jgi:hypothetical protein